MTAEPGEDLCLDCHHPDHQGGECRVLVGTFHGDDGSTEDDLCDCVVLHPFPSTDTAVPPPL